ncbi:hypothetical protein MKX01_035069 [Papaver californicum]|nr:hypothetical protein MKX01_035069 [Papaver californicum]
MPSARFERQYAYEIIEDKRTYHCFRVGWGRALEDLREMLEFTPADKPCSATFRALLHLLEVELFLYRVWQITSNCEVLTFSWALYIYL